MGTRYNVSETGLITTAAGINLPTTGGTPTTLTYHQKESIVFSVSGPWVAQNWTVTFTRIGDAVIVSWPDLSAVITVNAQTITTSTPIPVRYRPTAKSFAIKVINGASPIGFASGDFLVLTGGVINITANNNSPFGNNPNFAGIITGSVCWNI